MQSEDHPQPTKKQQSKPKRYKYCCRKCKHTEVGKKSCVCVVPLSQRRTSLGDIGCQTCKCKGCSIEDYISRGEDPQYHPQPAESSNDQKFDAKNGCCRKCMRAFSKNKKSCLCQVPRNVRKSRLPQGGCKVCGCEGCNPRDKDSSFSDDYSSYSQRRSRYSSSESRNYDEVQQNFNNLQRSVLGRVIAVQYSLYGPMLGFGIPQRTPSYILGRPL